MKLLHINYTQEIVHCGECWHDWEGHCELTGTKIEDHWEGVQEDCPLEDVEE